MSNVTSNPNFGMERNCVISCASLVLFTSTCCHNRGSLATFRMCVEICKRLFLSETFKKLKILTNKRWDNENRQVIFNFNLSEIEIFFSDQWVVTLQVSNKMWEDGITSCLLQAKSDCWGKLLESRFCSSSLGLFHCSLTVGLVLSRRARTADCLWGPNSPEDLKNFLLFRHGYKNVDIRRHFSIWEHGLSVNNSDSFTENTVLGAVRDVTELVTSFADMTDVLIIY